jgi:hypothetical protein
MPTTTFRLAIPPDLALRPAKSSSSRLAQTRVATTPAFGEVKARTTKISRRSGVTYYRPGMLARKRGPRRTPLPAAPLRHNRPSQIYRFTAVQGEWRAPDRRGLIVMLAGLVLVAIALGIVLARCVDRSVATAQRGKHRAEARAAEVGTRRGAVARNRR